VRCHNLARALYAQGPPTHQPPSQSHAVALLKIPAMSQQGEVTVRQPAARPWTSAMPRA
jgi:hypothetical protein